MHRKNIILCGFMGCGKTTVGKELAWRIFYDYVDLDEEIERLAGMSIPDIFTKQGEESFRELETKVLTELCGRSGQVIATGGGALTRTRNAEIAKASHSSIVFVNTEFETCYERIRESDRPLVQGCTREQLEQLFEERLPSYEAACNFQIFNQHTPKDAAKAIIYSLI